MEMELEGDELEPGYFYPGFWPLQRTYVGLREMNFYSIRQGGYFNIAYTGIVDLQWRGRYYRPRFVDATIVSVRFYPCNGRDVFVLEPESVIAVTIPRTELKASGTLSNTYGLQTRLPSSIPFMFTTPNQATYTGSFNNSATALYYTTTGTVNTNAGTFAMVADAMNIPITVPETADAGIDYYVVQSATTGITSNIDYLARYSVDANGYMICSSWVEGYPITFFSGSGLEKIARYDQGADVYVDSVYGGDMTVSNAGVLSDNKGPSMSIVNRFVTHFGLDPIINTSVVDDAVEDAADLVGGTSDAVKDSIGAVGDSTFEDSLAGVFGQSPGDAQMVFPGFSMAVGGQSYQIWDSQTFSFQSIEDNFPALIVAVRAVLSVLCYLAVINYLHKVYVRIFEDGKDT